MTYTSDMHSLGLAVILYHFLLSTHFALYTIIVYYKHYSDGSNDERIKIITF
jgi:hypothetical protein